MPTFAEALDAIPMVADAAAREARFPLATRAQDQRVFNKATGSIERWSGSAWVVDFAPSALPGSVTGVDNVALGALALASLTSGFDNTGVGYKALTATTGGANNVAVGKETLVANTTGSTNTAVGVTSMISNTTGSNNTSLGVDSLFTNTTGSNNTAIGSNALGFGDGGDSNVAVGWRALFNGGAGLRNTAVGLQCLNGMLTGADNTAYGNTALYTNTSGSRNVAIGASALLNNATGSRNVAVGTLAGAYELGSDAFYIDNQDRGSTAADKAGALLYGTFSATPASQTLTINAITTIPNRLMVNHPSSPWGTAVWGSGGTNLVALGNLSGVATIQGHTAALAAYAPLAINPGAGTVAIASTGVATSVLGSLAVAQAFGCNGATAQSAAPSGGALAAYGAGTNGFDTAGHAQALYNLVVAIRAALVANGIMS